MIIEVDYKKNSYDDLGRYFFTLIKILNDNCNKIFVKEYPWIKEYTYSKLIYKLSNVFFSKSFDNVNYTISDVGNLEITINDGIIKNNIYLGPTMHPIMYDNNSYLNINQFRRNKKNIGIIFGGNTDYKVYHTDHNLFNRFILANLAKRHESYSEIKNLNDLNKKLINNLIIIEKEKLYIPNSEWLNKISRSKFFLCLPGCVTENYFTFCKNNINYVTHNIAEAMSVGSIPIIYKNNLFYNDLKNNYNCLIYNTPKEMMKIIDHAFSLKDDEYSFIRQNVINYYDNNLTTSKIFEKIIN